MGAKVLIEKKNESVSLLTLNNPDTLNALSTDFMYDINEAIDIIENDKSVKVLIITGVGKAFIAGADIKEMIELTPAQTLEWGQLGSKLNTKVENMRIPVIAAVNGFALGGGCELAMACDIRIASEKAKFGQPEVGIGITPGAGGTQRLPRLVGIAKAKELLYTGKIIDAIEAEKIGLVNSVVPADELLQKAMEMANEISMQAQIAVQECKRLINSGIQTDINTGLALELQAFSLCSSTQDKQIGMGAFIRKEKEKKFIYK
ncbi:enoyl-CoA hydratase-related protein [Criibacterium bergeronii]|uniref:short-chain-enoyl-CoA hydratase n=1 Tax=Criibacterium bergeronii TaxID=1871336 RepID=A0A371IKP6_9FIRM|nr:enoyl-CoA hydratase-related protein [Criibacterium bergeronii]RDY21068.1 crotonase [Criibacterium bergeronii]TRW28381.1 crotonase [Criibacterium bergeronii]